MFGNSELVSEYDSKTGLTYYYPKQYATSKSKLANQVLIKNTGNGKITKPMEYNQPLELTPQDIDHHLMDFLKNSPYKKM